MWWSTLAAAVVATISCTIAVMLAPLGCGAVVAIAGIIYLATWSPRLAIALWLIATLFIPSWTPIFIGPLALPPTFIVGLPVMIGLGLGGHLKLRPIWIDYVLLATFGATISIVALQGLPNYLLGGVALSLLFPYLVGRLAPTVTQKAFLWLALVLALWGCMEFIFDLHVFTEWPALPGNYWFDIQVRGGLARSEASLGHAIAYGAVLAAAIPFAAALPRYSGLAQLVLFAGLLVSFSRGPLLSAALTAVLASALLTARVSKSRALIHGAVGLALGIAAIVALYAGPGTEELERSSAIRGNQTTDYLGVLRVLGAAPVQDVLRSGITADGRVIIDNAALRLALDFGVLVAVGLLLPILYCACSLMGRRATPASVALAGQIPVLLVTSFITQWQTILFWLLGVAVAQLVSPSPANRNGGSRRRLWGPGSFEATPRMETRDARIGASHPDRRSTL
jgi:hypothetical protein